MGVGGCEFNDTTGLTGQSFLLNSHGKKQTEFSLELGCVCPT